MTSVGTKLVTLTSVLLLSACHYGCAEYEAYVGNEKQRLELVDWADKNVFSRTFSKDDYEVGGISWPGLFRFSAIHSKVRFPEQFKDSRFEIRVLDKDGSHPNAIFIGKFNSKGIVIFRNGIEDIKDDSYIKQNQIGSGQGRIALICQ